MAKRNQRDQSEAYAEIHRLMERPLSDENYAELWEDSESTIEGYIADVRQKALPAVSRHDLGEACFWLAFLGKLWNIPDHQNLVVDLLSPSMGLDLMAVLPTVIKFKEASDASYRRMVGELGRAKQPPPLSDAYIPF